MTIKQTVLTAISEERIFQDRKWGNIDLNPYEVGSCLLIMETCLHKAKLAYSSQKGDEGALDEIRKAVAVGVACMEQHGPVFRDPIDFVE